MPKGNECAKTVKERRKELTFVGWLL